MTPTLQALQRFDEKHQGAVTLSDLGLELFTTPERNWYPEAGPANGWTFAGTGGDFVHYCLLEVAGSISELSPVVMVVPCASERLVVGDTLFDFLALGSITGYFFLEQLVYEGEASLEWLFDYNLFLRYCYGGAMPPESDRERLAAERQLLQKLSAEFGLTSWVSPRSRLAALQQKWAKAILVD